MNFEGVSENSVYETTLRCAGYLNHGDCNIPAQWSVFLKLAGFAQNSEGERAGFDFPLAPGLHDIGRSAFPDEFGTTPEGQNIPVTLQTRFEIPLPADSSNTMPIDEHSNFACGPLLCQTIRRHHRDDASGATLMDNPGTASSSRSNSRRQTKADSKCVTAEYQPKRCPRVRARDGTEAQYKSFANAEADLTFMGRCATKPYLDRVNQSHRGAYAFLGAA
jgi:hypothetical protein